MSKSLPEYKSLDHGSTVVVCNNLSEFRYMVAWCEDNGKLPPLLCDPKKYPFCVATKDGGWTDRMDRSLYYMSFLEFISTATPQESDK